MLNRSIVNDPANHFPFNQTFSMYYVAKSLISSLPNQDPEKEQHEQARIKAVANLRRLDRSRDHDNSEDQSGREDSNAKRARKEDLVLDQYESQIAMEVVAPEDIPVGFDGKFGWSLLETTADAVRYWRSGRHHRGAQRICHIPTHYASLILTLVATPCRSIRCTFIWTTRVREYLSFPKDFECPFSLYFQYTVYFDRLTSKQRCGKTMLAKALAHESGACFINLHISTLTEKWYGDSNKLVRAVFSLARKLQPSIVFIDEIDAVLGQRRSGEHEASGMVKAE